MRYFIENAAILDRMQISLNLWFHRTTKVTGGNGAQRNCRPVQRLLAKMTSSFLTLPF